MKWVIGLVALGLLAGCGGAAKKEPKVAEIGPDAVCEKVKVTVFDSTRIQTPPKDIPEAWKAFSGVWGQAGWDDYWCHDLYVMKIDEDGKVLLMDTHGPGGGHEGTAFARVGKLSNDNRLRFRADGIEREYWVENGVLMGVRKIGPSSTMDIAMLPKPR